MAKLIQLPEGSWIDPNTVTSVKAFPASEGLTGEVHKDRVSVATRKDGYIVIDCKTWVEAQVTRDQIARQVNDTRDARDDSGPLPPASAREWVEWSSELKKW